MGPAHILLPELGLRASPRTLRGSGYGLRRHKPFPVFGAQHLRDFAAGHRGAGQPAWGHGPHARDVQVVEAGNGLSDASSSVELVGVSVETYSGAAFCTSGGAA